MRRLTFGLLVSVCLIPCVQGRYEGKPNALTAARRGPGGPPPVSQGRDSVFR